MRVVLFCHSLLSDWNHGNAHFLRGIVTELCERGHEVRVYEPEEAWSMQNLLAEPRGQEALDAVRLIYPRVRPIRYDARTLELETVVDGADLVIVHEWSTPELVQGLGELRARGGRFRLLFHDTHHRSATAPHEMARYALAHYDGVLAFGEIIRQLYLSKGWAQRAWTWHEAADTRVFRPVQGLKREEDLVWIGNWGDEERTAELHEFLLGPAKALGLKATVHGVRYPDEARAALAEAGITYKGWLPNHEAPQAFARVKVTVHVPRRPYVRALPGIPTIRPFEALACGIPLVSAPWWDAEGLFQQGADFLVASTGEEMKRTLRKLLADEAMRRELAERGRRTVLARHTCAHRVEELLIICRELGMNIRSARPTMWERVSA